MSENARKRSRKSKLVPRDCSDFSEVNNVLQEPPSKKALLTKIKKEDDSIDDEAAQTALQFSVNVEVEDIVESVSDEDPSDYMRYLFSLSNRPEPSIVPEKRPEDDKAFTLDFFKVQKLLPHLHKHFPTERDLMVAVRNGWGKCFAETIEIENKQTTKDKQLMEALNQWKLWQVNVRLKETPYSYKCYVCMNAWWNLHDFWEHIKRHPDCSIQMEIKHTEFSIIAYEGKKMPTPSDIMIYGNCLKCTKTYSEHRECKRYSDSHYYCVHCNDKFQTCTSLNRHLGICIRNPVRTTAVIKDIMNDENKFVVNICKVCDTVFLTKTELYFHKEICHSVRSDEPVPSNFKVCRLCDQPYYTFVFHVCTKKNKLHSCKYCHALFQHRSMLDIHLRTSENSVTCSVCQKFIIRECMAPEHYVTHSTNFSVAYRCLNCKRIKLLLTEDSARNHRSKYHRKIDYRRPGWEKIIVPKVMLEECKVVSNAQRKNKCRILQGNKKALKTYENKAKLKVIQRTKEIAGEKEDSNSTADNESVDSKVDGDAMADEEAAEDTAEDTITEDTSTVDTVAEDNKDFPKLLKQITEDIDIKPDIIRVKEERMSDTEEVDPIPSVSEETKPEINTIDLGVTKVFKVTNEADIDTLLDSTATGIADLDKDSRNVFQVSEGTSKSETVVKQDIKEEVDDFEDDLIILNSSSDSVKHDNVDSENSELGILSLEPEVILNAGYRKRKVYKCNKCDYEGFHKEYKQHMSNSCARMPTIMKNVPSADIRYICTKCNKSFRHLKSYVNHFVHHKYRYMSCPQCKVTFDTNTKLMSHFNSHIKSQFVRMQLIKSKEFDDDEEKMKVFQCKSCKEVVKVEDCFKHWESHLVLCPDIQPPKKKRPVECNALESTTEKSLRPEALNQILALLQPQDITGDIKDIPRKVKTCFVCDRDFDRQNDCKRHLVEHLLEDAYANIVDTMQLKCQICQELFIKPHCYKKHMRDHASLPIFQCSLCNKTFSDSSNFTKHKKIHNLRAFVCDICSKKFQAKLSLEKHMMMHMNCDPYTCDSCDRVFYDRSFLNRHMRNHHDKSFVKFRCTTCRQRFQSLREKWDHMWEVHKQRKEKADCPVCKKSFRKFIDVKRHARGAHGIHISLASVFQMMQEYPNKINVQRIKLIHVDNGRAVNDSVDGVVFSQSRVSQSFVAGNVFSQTSASETVVDSAVSQANVSQSGIDSDVLSQASVSQNSIDSDGNVQATVSVGQDDNLADSDDDVLLIEEERETLVILDDDVPGVES